MPCDLNNLPDDTRGRKLCLLGPTGYVLHAVGGLVSAAVNGHIPTDYLIFDWGALPGFTATYMDKMYAARLEANATLQIRIAAGGLAAEAAVFGEICQPRSKQNLDWIASVLGMRVAQQHQNAFAEWVLTEFWPIPESRRDLLIKVYQDVAGKISSEHYRLPGRPVDVIAFHELAHMDEAIPPNDRMMAAERTRSRQGRQKIIDRALDADLAAGICS